MCVYSTVQDCESCIDRVLNAVVEQRIIKIHLMSVASLPACHTKQICSELKFK